jgi:kelch-like protein 18
LGEIFKEFFFFKVILHDEYLVLQKNKLIEFICDDNLNVLNEDVVFNACIKWLDYASESRTQEFHLVS